MMGRESGGLLILVVQVGGMLISRRSGLVIGKCSMVLEGHPR